MSLKFNVFFVRLPSARQILPGPGVSSSKARDDTGLGRLMKRSGRDDKSANSAV